MSAQPVLVTHEPIVEWQPANDHGAMAAIRIARMDQIGPAVWDAFVLREQSTTFFHLSGWQRVIAKTYGYDAHYLAAIRNGRIIGVLPLIHLPSPLFGGALVSTAFCIYGGIAASEPDAVPALAQAAAELAERLDVDYVELRGEESPIAGWIGDNVTFAAFRRDLHRTERENLDAIPIGKREELRRQHISESQIDASGDLDAFYYVLSKSMRDQGVPVFAKRFAEAIQAEFQCACEVAVARGPAGPAAAQLSFYYRDMVLPYWRGSARDPISLSAADQLLWFLMRQAVSRGAAEFDFGRARYGSSEFRDKVRWGFEPRTLTHQYRLLKTETLADTDPHGPYSRIMAMAWRRLPLSLANRIGPCISKQQG
jgi:FemAB-related protein (PEP-CTERM system-associated)